MGSINISKQDQELLELTLQVRNRKENDERYAQFRGDNLIGNQIVPKTSLLTDIATVLQPSNWGALKRTIDGFIKGKGIDVTTLEKSFLNALVLTSTLRAKVLPLLQEAFPTTALSDKSSSMAKSRTNTTRCCIHL
jgi:hypothetical protein